MAVYIVTGKLGSGKTLLACMKAQEYLKRRCPIAANIEFNLESLCKPTNDYSRFVRLPDMPTADDLTSLGMGCDKYDEERFGAIFLDEAGIWLNSRKWNSSGRIDLLEFFLYLRKRRWDLWLIVQNIDVVDKQIRQAIAEHVVYCSRSDRYQMPFLPKVIINIITVGLINFIKMPKFHTAVCKYGISKLAPNSDVWHYRGVDFYDAYNTMQQFDSNYDFGCYSVLPPAYSLRISRNRVLRYQAYLKTLPLRIDKPTPIFKKIMRLTKIYFRKVSVPASFSVGALLMFFCLSIVYTFFIKPSDDLFIKSANAEVKDQNQNQNQKQKVASGFSLGSFGGSNGSLQASISQLLTPDYIKQLKIASYAQLPNGLVSYKFKGIDGAIVTEQILLNSDFIIKNGDRYHVQIQTSEGDAFTILRY